MTANEKKWLTHLRDNGAQPRTGRGPVAHNCRMRGWTEWVYADKVTRELLTRDQARERYPDRAWFEQVYVGDLERITEEGRNALREVEDDGKDK